MPVLGGCALVPLPLPDPFRPGAVRQDGPGAGAAASVATLIRAEQQALTSEEEP